MGAPLTEPDRLAGWLGMTFTADSADYMRAAAVITTISDLVRGEARRLEWTAEDVPANVAAIVLMVSVECWVNPDGKTSVTVEEVTRRWERGDLFSNAQLATIRSFRPNASSGLSTAQFSRGLDSPSIRVPVSGYAPIALYDGRGY
ncbi:hypothetical protein [Microbacterium sp. MMO-10]|uniref:hypothetical protein n=1 Tax=Microbacterium sp. MMO-10 TaxID=3081272 RepID=UPI0030176C8A